MQKPPAAVTFPLTIKRGHAVVKVYRMKQRNGCNYAVTFVTPTGRVKRNFTDLEIARREANTIAANLAGGDLEALKLTGRERQLYVAANEAIAHTGLTLDVVAREFAAAFDVLGRDAVIEAARFFKARAESTLPVLTVSEVVERFVAAKVAEGISPHYRKDLRFYLERGLAEHFKCNLTAVATDDLRSYLNAKKSGSVAKNNHRRLIVALFNFAKGAGYLPANESTAADALGTYRVKEKDVTIYTPEELSRLLQHADKDFLPWLALIAFGGVRHQELQKGLAWESIDFAKGTLIVLAAIAKTGRKRKLDMPENLRAWLEPYQGRRGAIFAKDPDARIGKTAAAAGVPWKRNALRHSFGSYRMEATKNAGQVSLEMGNSPAVVMAHYFEIVDACAAKAYWNIRPEAVESDAGEKEITV
jgi:integrase